MAAAAEDRVPLTHQVRTRPSGTRTGGARARARARAAARPEPERSGRSFPPCARRLLCRRAAPRRPPAPREGARRGSTLLLPPSFSPSFLSPSRLPGSSGSLGAGTTAVGTRSLGSCLDSGLGDSSSNRVRGRVRAPANLGCCPSDPVSLLRAFHSPSIRGSGCGRRMGRPISVHRPGAQPALGGLLEKLLHVPLQRRTQSGLQ